MGRAIEITEVINNSRSFNPDSSGRWVRSSGQQRGRGQRGDLVTKVRKGATNALRPYFSTTALLGIKLLSRTANRAILIHITPMVAYKKPGGVAQIMRGNANEIQRAIVREFHIAFDHQIEDVKVQMNHENGKIREIKVIVMGISYNIDNFDHEIRDMISGSVSTDTRNY